MQQTPAAGESGPATSDAKDEETGAGTPLDDQDCESVAGGDGALQPGGGSFGGGGASGGW